jgi:hypothetical protein
VQHVRVGVQAVHGVVLPVDFVLQRGISRVVYEWACHLERNWREGSSSLLPPCAGEAGRPLPRRRACCKRQPRRRICDASQEQNPRRDLPPAGRSGLRALRWWFNMSR